MDKQKEIEEMAHTIKTAQGIGYYFPTKVALRIAKGLFEAGYGDVHAAVKEFVSNLQNAIVINELIRNKNERMVVFAEIEELVKEYENELFGKTEQVNHEKGDVRR